jgi:hypothetical protein
MAKQANKQRSDQLRLRRERAQDDYNRLRRTHIKLGGIAAGAETLARQGDFAGANEWLRRANRHSDFIRNPHGGAR